MPINKEADLYLLITSARNEEAFIEKTIKSVISQTILPKKWIIVNDGSTDRTGEIINKYSNEYDFIEVIETDGDSERNFGSKAKAVNYAYDKFKHLKHSYIGNLDADVSFDINYYEKILGKFEKDSKLGLAGGVRYDLVNGRFVKLKVHKNSVGGPFQFFRRKCFNDVGGYIPLKYGGIDAVAETMARMKNWKVESYPELEIYHYRPTGTAKHNLLSDRFQGGIKDYLIGYHPIFETVRALYRVAQRPFLIGSIAYLSGYFWAAIKKLERPVPDDFVAYLRNEQLARLRSHF